MKVPLSKVPVDDDLRQRIVRAIDSGQYILGPECKAFEAELAAWLARKHVILVSNATSAATLTLQALGIGAGDEVLVPSHTAFPTIEAIYDAGATPVFLDIDETYTLDPAWLETHVTPRTKAIVPVHLYGHPCDMDAVTACAKKHALAVVEDCAQAHGARYRGRLVGTFGVAATFSFYPSKNLPVLGDGGAIATDDGALAARLRMLRDHGRSDKHTHQVVGWNMRFNEIQAASGRYFLARLEASNDRRREAAARYRARLEDVAGVRLPVEREWARSVYHLFVIRVKDRDALAKKLEAAGVQTGVHYPVPNHLQPACLNDRRTRAEALPATEAAAKEILSLPIFPTIEDAEIDHVCDAVARHVGALAAAKV